MQYLSVV
jgi:hypothetical protein